MFKNQKNTQLKKKNIRFLNRLILTNRFFIKLIVHDGFPDEILTHSTVHTIYTHIVHTASRHITHNMNAIFSFAY